MKSAVLAIACCAGCLTTEVGGGDEAGLEEIDYQFDNGIFLDNGLNLGNGMNLGNGIDALNGMNLGNGLYAPPTGSGFEQWIDVDPPARKKILRYLVECALPAGVQVQLSYRGAVELLGTGALGLGPSLEDGELAEDEQEAVSACMLARVNGWGDAVRIDLFGAYPGLDVSTASDAPYRRYEATYFGNLFTADPIAYVCTQSRRGCDQMRGCRAASDGTCDCGVFETGGFVPGHAHCGTGFTNDIGIQGFDCHQGESLESTQYYLKDCVDVWGKPWSAPITVWFAPRANGETCRYDDMCDSWSCNAGTCAARKSYGGTCDSELDCLNGKCVDGFCGMAVGSYCVSGLQCRSGSCSKKHACL